MNEKIKVFLIKKGCPLCHSDVIGNNEVGYYCKHCNLLFSFDQLNKESLEEKQPVKIFDELSERNIEEREQLEDKNKDINKSVSSDNPSNNKNSCEDKETYFVASKFSNKFHIPQCPFAKNIKKENLIVFDTKEKALSAGFKPCKCVKEV